MNLRTHKQRAYAGWLFRYIEAPKYPTFTVAPCWIVRRDSKGRRNWIMGSLVRPLGWHPTKGWAKP